MTEFLQSLFTGLMFLGIVILAITFWPVTVTIWAVLMTAWVGGFIREVVWVAPRREAIDYDDPFAR